MEEIKKVIKLSPNDYFAKHLELMSGLLPVALSPKEILVLSKFMAFEGALVEDDRFNSIVRKKVRLEAKISPGNMANYLKSIREKGYISKSESGMIKVHPRLWPQLETQEYNITLIKDGTKTS